jgi:SAM-dependent methyltransferase
MGDAVWRRTVVTPASAQTMTIGQTRTIESCLVCGQRSFTEIYSATFDKSWKDAIPFFLTDREHALHGRIVRCNACTFVFTTPQFEVAAYNRIYESITQTAPHRRERAALARVRRLKQRVVDHIRQGRFFELGCGDGAFLNQMTGFQGIGFEIRPIMPHHESRVVSADFLEWSVSHSKDFTDSFDFCVAWDVLEHLPALDEYMVAVNRSLKADGLFFVTLPDLSSAAARISGEKWNCFLLEHLWYFSPITFRKYVRRFGFDLEHTESFRFPVDLGTLMLRLAQIYGTPISQLPGWLERIVVALPIGLMFAVCRKTDGDRSPRSAAVGASRDVPVAVEIGRQASIASGH